MSDSPPAPDGHAARPAYLADGSFQGQVAVVTGGGTGLGLETSTLLGRLGATVVCVSRNTEHHDELKRRGQTLGFPVHSHALDVRDAHQVKAVVREIRDTCGRIDVLVNNAAGNFLRPALVLAPKAFATVIDIALNGVFTMSREVARTMRTQDPEGDRGRIVNISAPYATTGKPGVVHSACAKAGVEAMTRTLAAEWAPLGIRVNAISPGPFVSDGAADRLWPSEELEQAVLDQIPLGRFGRASEVARLVTLLASRDLPWVTGAIWLADGGWSLPDSLLPPDTGRVDRRRPDASS